MHMFYILLYQKLDFVLDTCKPNKSVMFALDGPAPLAKLVTQRIRRKRVELTAAEEDGKTVSPLALTPGTAFMQEVGDALAYFICQRLVSNKWKHLRMDISGATVKAGYILCTPFRLSRSGGRRVKDLGEASVSDGPRPTGGHSCLDRQRLGLDCDVAYGQSSEGLCPG